MKEIFAISGFAQHGKDSTANILGKLLGGNYLVVHNADYLKYICKQYMGWDGNKDEKGRNLLQKVGTDRIRLGMDKPSFWIEKTCEIIEIFRENYDYFMIPDCRFLNELFYPKAKFPYNVTTIRVHRLFFDNGLTPEQKKHPSEIELADFRHDFHIYSESGLDKLEVEIKKILEDLRR
jgi:hypothetical protein